MDMQQNEFSRLIELDDSILEKKFESKAEKHELEALAKRLDVFKINDFKLDYIITNKQDILGAYTLIASIEAKIVKFLVEGNEESTEIKDKFDVILLTEDMARNNYEQLKDFDIEVFDEDKKVDVGEIATQYLSLCVFM